MPKQRTHKVRRDLILRECDRRGWQLQQLAFSAKLDPKTVTNVIQHGKPAALKTIAKFAEALGIGCDALIVHPNGLNPAVHHGSQVSVNFGLVVTGIVPSELSDDAVENVLVDVQEAFEKNDVAVTSFTSTVKQTSHAMDDTVRIVMLVTGFLDSGDQFWVYIAVKPSRFPTISHELSTIYPSILYDFDDYGEVIATGHGNRPSRETTTKVAKLYGADVNQVLATIHGEGS